MSKDVPKLAYTVGEAAAAVGVSKPTLYSWMKRPDFPVAKIGSNTRIPVEAFKRWLEKQIKASAQEEK